MATNRSHNGGRLQPAPSLPTCRALAEALGRWYASNRRDLPWRRTGDPYRIWVSEVMLQQTQVRTAIPYYNRFIVHFPDVAALARADLQRVLKLWEGLGYYSRARNLHKAACIVQADLGGRIPDTLEALRRLPGIGDYIAAAVLSIAFGRAHAVVDGNVKRVLARLFLNDTPVNQNAAHKIFQNLAGRLLDRDRPGEHNQAMMELGAVVCTPRTPRCGDCPVAGLCMARENDAVQDYPRRQPRAAIPTRRVAAGVVLKKGRVLLVKRPDQGLLGGMWEFPGGPFESDEDSAGICIKQLQSTTNLVVTIDHRVGAVSHAYTHFRLHLVIYLCRWRSGRVRLNGPVAFKWVAPAKIGELPLHGAVHKALANLEGLI